MPSVPTVPRGRQIPSNSSGNFPVISKGGDSKESIGFGVSRGLNSISTPAQVGTLGKTSLTLLPHCQVKTMPTCGVAIKFEKTMYAGYMAEFLEEELTLINGSVMRLRSICEFREGPLVSCFA